MHIDALMPVLVGTAFVVLLLTVLSRRLRQPLIVAYLIAGVVLGPQVLGLIPDAAVVRRLGEFGLVLLLFFLGMELHLPRLLSNWRVAVGGTVIQILVSVALVLALGGLLGWPLERGILLGFVISLSSTAVVVPLLRDWGDLKTPVGEDVLGILLVQDMALVPMLIVIGLIAGEQVSAGRIGLQLVGAVAVIGLVVLSQRSSEFHLPFSRWIEGDREMQIFAAFTVCFGMALLTALLGLSTALGAFVAGILVASTRETEWVVESMESFRIVLVAFFFLGIGTLLDLGFLWANFLVVVTLTALAVGLNTVVNALVLRGLGRKWPRAWYGGSLLSQIGEFSFVLAAVGLQAGIVSGFAYQSTVAVIALTMLVSPAWIRVFRRYGMRGGGAGG